MDLVDIELSQRYKSVMEVFKYAHKKGIPCYYSEHHFDENISRRYAGNTRKR